VTLTGVGKNPAVINWTAIKYLRFKAVSTAEILKPSLRSAVAGLPVSLKLKLVKSIQKHPLPSGGPFAIQSLKKVDRLVPKITSPVVVPLTGNPVTTAVEEANKLQKRGIVNATFTTGLLAVPVMDTLEPGLTVMIPVFSKIGFVPLRVFSTPFSATKSVTPVVGAVTGNQLELIDGSLPPNSLVMRRTYITLSTDDIATSFLTY
jgi:hypothetical protein